MGRMGSTGIRFFPNYKHHLTKKKWAALRVANYTGPGLNENQSSAGKNPGNGPNIDLGDGSNLYDYIPPAWSKRGDGYYWSDWEKTPYFSSDLEGGFIGPPSPEGQIGEYDGPTDGDDPGPGDDDFCGPPAPVDSEGDEEPGCLDLPDGRGYSVGDTGTDGDGDGGGFGYPFPGGSASRWSIRGYTGGIGVRRFIPPDDDGGVTSHDHGECDTPGWDGGDPAGFNWAECTGRQDPEPPPTGAGDWLEPDTGGGGFEIRYRVWRNSPNDSTWH